MVSDTVETDKKVLKTDENDSSSSLRQQRAYRPAYERLFFPLGVLISKFASANAVSYFGVFLSIISMIAFYFSQNDEFWFIYLALLFMGLSSLADMIDGSVARAEKAKGKKIGKYGALLDPVADRYAEVFFLIGILLSNYVPPEWVLFSFAGMIMASYTRARAESLGPDSEGNKLFISAGIERKEKLIIIGIGAFLEALLIQTQSKEIWPYISFGQFAIGPLAWGVIITAILSHLAAYQRLRLAKKYLVELE
ncbi:MAG: CDP-alcohol phosphatidyltransferase family protein [Candidatus Hodarchaeales archaeon]